MTHRRYLLRRLKGLDLTADAGNYRGRLDAVLSRATALRDTDLTSPAVGPRGAGDEDEALARAVAAAAQGLGLVPFEGQVLAALGLLGPRVVEMATGEGKTLAAALAAAALALEGHRVHLLTANDYLARRDAAWMAPLYGRLGLKVASIGAVAGSEERRAAYAGPLLYATAREVGFDLLRDGLAQASADLIQGPFDTAIVDEADFLLIDEARVPLVIAGEADGEGEGEAGVAAELAAAAQVVAGLVPERDCVVDPEGRKVGLTSAGLEAVEGALGGLSPEGPSLEPRLLARVHGALHARFLLAKDRDYVIREGRIDLVDPFTGRVLPRRALPWGIQAALEWQEGLTPRPEGRIIGSLPVQHLMGLYPRLSGMTATALPAAEELGDAYGLGVLLVPPRLPCRRKDLEDRIFQRAREKVEAIVDEVVVTHRGGRPVLVGTASVADSEDLARRLEARGLACVVLNARNDAQEASIIARAGEAGAITVSTNMAGRGVDIRLGPGVAALGGLHVIGASRHASRRLDDQLRGRAGRQGDPGSSRFFASLEDEVFRRYGVAAFLPKDPASPGGSGADLGDPRVSREVARAQAIIEGQNARSREALRRYSLLVEHDRRHLRRLRDEALAEGRDPRALDDFWADHLAFVESWTEGLSLLRYGNLDPGREFVRVVGDAFEAGLARALEAQGEVGSPPPEAPPPRAGATWTYAVEPDALPGSALGLPGGAAAALALGPLALPLLLLRALLARRASGARRGDGDSRGSQLGVRDGRCRFGRL